MDNRAIGVFDSGLGGLTAVRALRERAPLESVVYFGDTGRVPYGTRSAETITRYTRQALSFLHTFNIKTVIVACGTVSSAAFPLLTAEEKAGLTGVVEPAVTRAVGFAPNGRVGLIGTAATVASRAYHDALRNHNAAMTLTAAACPLLVPLVENGRCHPGDFVAETVAREYLAQIKQNDVDCLILGCTHYPLLSEVIAAEMGPKVTLIDAGREAALAALENLCSLDALADAKSPDRYYVSDSAPGFAALASVFLNEDLQGRVEKTTLP